MKRPSTGQIKRNTVVNITWSWTIVSCCFQIWWKFSVSSMWNMQLCEKKESVFWYNAKVLLDSKSKLILYWIFKKTSRFLKTKWLYSLCSHSFRRHVEMPWLRGKEVAMISKQMRSTYPFSLLSSPRNSQRNQFDVPNSKQDLLRCCLGWLKIWFLLASSTVLAIWVVKWRKAWNCFGKHKSL